jgi:hypothetical protein
MRLIAQHVETRYLAYVACGFLALAVFGAVLMGPAMP